MPISFPGLFGDWEINPSPKAIDIGNGVYWYGIIICAGLILAVLFCVRQAKHYGIEEESIYDLMLWEIPLCILGARVYYVLFYLDRFRRPDGSLDWMSTVRIWDGGIAIYGAVITSAVVLFLFARHRKIPFGAYADLGVMGLLIGQAVGRWGNFMNREAFGAETTLPWRMRLWTSATEYIEVHPTFLYESLWNILGLLLIVFLVAKARTFDGESTCFYFIWYGIGRAVIEGLRTDSLYLFGWELFGRPIRVSQLLSMVLAAGAFVVLLVNKRRHPSGKEALYVTRKAAAEAAAAAAASEAVAPATPAPDSPAGEDSAAAAAAGDAPAAGETDASVPEGGSGSGEEVPEDTDDQI